MGCAQLVRSVLAAPGSNVRRASLPDASYDETEQEVVNISSEISVRRHIFKQDTWLSHGMGWTGRWRVRPREVWRGLAWFGTSR
jgi:hypothetical protein